LSDHPLTAMQNVMEVVRWETFRPWR